MLHKFYQRKGATNKTGKRRILSELHTHCRISVYTEILTTRKLILSRKYNLGSNVDCHFKKIIKHEYIVCKIGPMSFNTVFTIYGQLSFGFDLQFFKKHLIKK